MPIWSIFEEAHYRETPPNSKVRNIEPVNSMAFATPFTAPIFFPMKSSTERFSDRVEYYVKHRPGYLAPMIQMLRQMVFIPALVADIGSGTGILSRQLIAVGYEVCRDDPA
jgi:hypothetical protein